MLKKYVNRMVISATLGIISFVYIGYFHSWGLALAIFLGTWGNNINILVRMDLDKDKRDAWLETILDKIPKKNPAGLKAKQSLERKKGLH